MTLDLLFVIFQQQQQHTPYNRNKEMFMFLCGDYAFICVVYGLSAASGETHVTISHDIPYSKKHAFTRDIDASGVRSGVTN